VAAEGSVRHAGSTIARHTANGTPCAAAVAALFSAHGEGFQALSAEAALFHERFVQALTSSGLAYAASEAANASPLGAFEGAIGFVGQEIEQTSTPLITGFTRAINTIVGDIFGFPAAPPFPATQGGTYTGNPSLITRLEEVALLPVKPLLNLSGLESQLSNPNSPLLALFASNIPPISWVLGNQPPPFLNLLLGESVQYTSYHGMHVVQITPSHPSGDYVVAIHGGAFIFPPSIFHWLDYSVMAFQTGATIEVPIYPLLQQGGTAGTVVPLMSKFIASQVGAHPTGTVSVIGDSAGGTLALAAVEMLEGTPNLPASMVLLSPWLDLGMTNPNIGLVQDPLLPLGPAQQIGKVWANGLSLTNPEVSPLYGTLAGLPPTYVYSGNMDILSPDALVLMQRAGTEGLDNINFVLANGQIHDWVLLTLDGPQYWSQIDRELGIAA